MLKALKLSSVRLLRAFAYVWFCVGAAVIALHLVAIWFDGLGVLEILAPEPFANLILTTLVVSPAIGAYMWAERLEGQAAATGNPRRRPIPLIIYVVVVAALLMALVAALLDLATGNRSTLPQPKDSEPLERVG